MSDETVERGKLGRKSDLKVLIAIGMSMALAFALILFLATAAYISEQQRVRHAALFSALIGDVTEIGSISQRIALLQFGTMGRKDAGLQSRLLSEVSDEVSRLSLVLGRVRSSAADPRFDDESRAELNRLIESAENFSDIAVKLQESVVAGGSSPELSGQLGDRVTKLINLTRSTTTIVSDNALRSASADENLAEDIYLVGMGAILMVGLVVSGMILTRLRRELLLRRAGQHRLIRANQELERFSAMVAHDLRGPLSNIGLAAQMISNGRNGGPGFTKEECLKIISSETGRLRDMIHGLLRLSRLNAAEFSPAWLSLSEMLDTVRRGIAKAIHEAGATISISGDAQVRGDKVLLENVFQNLIENSLKYRREGIAPKIEIECRSTPAYSELIYRDNGRGIPTEYREQVFEPFFQTAADKGIDGLGLGLSVVKKIIGAHGGYITIDDWEGPGTQFRIQLPVRPGRGEGRKAEDSLSPA